MCCPLPVTAVSPVVWAGSSIITVMRGPFVAVFVAERSRDGCVKKGFGYDEATSLDCVICIAHSCKVHGESTVSGNWGVCFMLPVQVNKEFETLCLNI